MKYYHSLYLLQITANRQLLKVDETTSWTEMNIKEVVSSDLHFWKR